jgi:hypothetical protein
VILGPLELVFYGGDLVLVGVPLPLLLIERKLPAVRAIGCGVYRGGVG